MVGVIALCCGLLAAVPASRAVLQDTLQNGDFEQSAGDGAYDWQVYGSGYERVPQGRSGWGLRVQADSLAGAAGAYQRIDLAQQHRVPLFVSAYVKGEDIALAPGSYFGAALYAEMHLTNGQVAYWNTIANAGTFDWRWIGFNTASVPTVTAPIDHMFILPVLLQASGAAVFDDVTVREVVQGSPAVSLVFDDGPDTTLTQAKPVLDAYGFAGTAAVISGAMGQPGYLSEGQVSDLYASGWEIMAHSVTHADMTTLSPERAAAEFADAKQQLAAYGVQSFAYPYGSYSGELNALGAAAYTSLRGFEQGSNAYGTYPYDVKVRGVTSATTLGEVGEWLATAREHRQWVVLVFHDISEAGEDSYHTPPEVFRQMIAAVAASHVPVVTYTHALQQFAVGP